MPISDLRSQFLRCLGSPHFYSVADLKRAHFESATEQTSAQQPSVVVMVVHMRLTIVKGLGPSTTVEVTRNGTHRVGDEAIIDGTSGILNVLRSISENSKLEGLQHHRLIRLLLRIMTVLMLKVWQNKGVSKAFSDL